MDLDLAGKVVVVGGSSRGIGFAVAEKFLLEGARVAICARDEAKLTEAGEQLRSRTGGEVLVVPADLTCATGIADVQRAVTGKWSTVHVLVNNVGGPPAAAAKDLTDAMWQSAFDQVVMAPVRLTREFLPFMLAQRWGRVINIQSYSVRQPVEGLALSNSLRLAVVGWAKTLANEVAKDGILINSVLPGWTSTERITDVLEQQAQSGTREVAEVKQAITATIPLGRMASADEIAGSIVFLASSAAGYITGACFQVDGGIIRGI